MAIDLEKLSPAPWGVCNMPFREPRAMLISHAKVSDKRQIATCVFDGSGRPDNVDFCALARNAFDVMMRRGWTALPKKGQWYAAATIEHDDSGPDSAPVKKGALWPDPFTALVESDRWYKENVEGR